MKKSIVISLVFVAVTVIAILFLLSNKAKAPVENAAPPSTTNTQSETRSQGNGTYQDYSEKALAEASGDKVLFFHASWCPQCIAIEKDIKKQGVPDGYSIFKVDYDNSSELKKKYGVTQQTTFVKIDKEENLVDKYVAYNEPTLAALKRDFLNN